MNSRLAPIEPTGTADAEARHVLRVADEDDRYTYCATVRTAEAPFGGIDGHEDASPPPES